MEREILFEEQAVTGFGFVEQYGMYARSLMPAPFALTAGEEYIVLWNDVEYTVTAIDIGAFFPGGVAVGNGSAFGLPGNNEPFIVAAFETDVALFVVDPTDTRDTHRFGIYKEAAEPANLILRDPDGTEQEYPMRQMLEVDTTEGGTVLYSKGEVLDSITIEPDFSAGDMTVSTLDGYLVKSAVITKPVDCEPENILKGKNIGGIHGELELPVLEDVTIEPDFSGGNMVVTPDAGKAFSGVTIVKPENLKPEIIAKGEVVAGIEGTHEGGVGGGEMPCIFEAQSATIGYDYNLSQGVRDTICNVSIQMLNAEIKSVRCNAQYYGALSASGLQTTMWPSLISDGPKDGYKITVGTRSISVTYSGTVNCTYRYGIRHSEVCVSFTIPGVVLKETAEGLTLFADSNLTKFSNAVISRAKDIKVVDWSESLITQLSANIFCGCDNLEKVILPSTITTVFANAFVNLKNVLSGLVIDFRRCTAVPKGYNLNFIDGLPNLQIIIPATLYNEWAASEWFTIAASIVPV